VIAMRLTNFSDYALRLLMFAASNTDRLVTIEETSRRFAISRGHLMKVANELTRAGFLKAVRGRSGGLRLGKPAETIRLSDVLGVVEPDFALAECFGTGNRCIITPHCRLRRALGEALAAFIAALDRYTVADLILDPEAFGLLPEVNKDALQKPTPVDEVAGAPVTTDRTA
jgi:Rrf2 family nitric oxide-sensitive transcriptional repressor